MAKKPVQDAVKTPIKFEAVTAKIPEETVKKFKELLEKTKQKRSALIRKLVEDYIKENSAPLYECDYCLKGVENNELYYVLLANRERVELSRKGKRVIMPEDSVTLKIYCEKCAKKDNFTKHFTAKRKTHSHEMHEIDKVAASERNL